MYRADIVADSMNSSGVRLTTWLLTYPLMVHAEHLRHREQSFCVASNRARPTHAILADVEANPFVPIFNGHKPGMQSAGSLSENDQLRMQREWLACRDINLVSARWFAGENVYKGQVNRLLYPWQWVTVVCSATRFDNFFALRAHKAAQEELQKPAVMMVEKYYNSQPVELMDGQWHLPFVEKYWELPPLHYEDLEFERRHLLHSDPRPQTAVMRALIQSAASCARTSYLNQEKDYPFEKQQELHDRLWYGQPPHASPFEHQACAEPHERSIRNFHGFRQYRCAIPGDTTWEFNYEEWKAEYYGN